MIKRIVAFSIFLFLGIGFSIAQTGSIKGEILDSESITEIPYASIVVTDVLTSKVISGITSNEKGKFKIDGISYGTFNVEVSFIGYENTSVKNITINSENLKVNLGEIILKPSTESLNEITIKATNKTQTTKIDRKSYNVTDFETAKGGNATDVLNKLPSVSVGSDGIVSVRGTTDFMVYLNGKPTQIEPSVLLAQISGNSIEKIDVISVPTARYDAQGKGGIINIVTTRKGIEGLSASANGFLGGAPWANITDKYSGYELNDNRFGGGFNLMYNKEKVSFYADFNYNSKNVNGKRDGDARVLVKYPEGEYYHMNAEGERPEWYKYYSTNLGVDFRLNDNEELSFSYFYGNRNNGRSAYYIYNTFYADADGSNKDEATENYIYNPNTDNRYGNYHTGSVDYSLKINEDKTLKLSGTFEKSGLSRDLSNINYFYDSPQEIDDDIENNYGSADLVDTYSMSDDTPLTGGRLSIDYNKDYENGNSLGLGGQLKYLNIKGDFIFNNSKVTADLDNSIDFDRGVYAAYVDFSGSKNKFNYILGLRTEYGNQNTYIKNTSYLEDFGLSDANYYSQNKFDFFPTAHVSFEASEKNKLIFAASRRINRPSLTNMAPFLYRRHFEVYVIGDPTLEAEYLNNVELTYETKLNKNSINLTGFYRGTENAVFRVNTTTTAIQNPTMHDLLQEDVLIRSYTNAGNSTSLGAELNANFTISSFAKLFIGGSLYNYQINGDVFGYTVDTNSTNWTLKGNVLLDLTETLNFNFDYNYKSGTVTSQGSNEHFSAANIAFKYQPKKLPGWDFSLRGLDIFGTNFQGLDTNAFNSEGEQIFYQETLYTRNGPIVEIGINYTFKKIGKSKKSKEVSAEKHFK